MAIPASILYVFFVSRVDRLVIEIDRLAQEVVNVISAEDLHERKNRRPRSRGADEYTPRGGIERSVRRVPCETAVREFQSDL